MKAATSRTANSPQFHFIGGKGGVGKTTCAAAFAIAAAGGRRVLVASTDPAPSLGDAFSARLTGAPRLLRPRLHAVEIDAAAVLRRWVADRRRSLETIAVEGTWLDAADVKALLDLSLPGIDEVASLLEIARLARLGRYDLIVVDTAPTGHTLRMLDMPETLAGVARVFDGMREKHRAMVEALRGVWRPEREDVLIQDLAREADGLRAMLTDSKRTHMTWVTLPEPMAIAETIEALRGLEARGIQVRDIVVNRMTLQGPRCSHCDARRALESAAVRRLAPAPSMFVAARDREPTGITALTAIARELASPGLKPWTTSGAPVVRPFTAALRGPQIAVDDVTTDETRLLLFGGKGGVGKTTCAAAAAVAVARHRRRRPVLLISADPAHSLADVFGSPIGDEPARVPGAPANLLVREMDSARVYDRLRAQYADAIEGIFVRFRGGSSFDLAHDRAVMRGLIDLAPPGLDELAAIVEITRDVAEERNALTIIDTAPTGHALRLLEMPALIHDWTRALMAILLKYQSVTGLGELGALLLELSRGIGRLRSLLKDDLRTRFIVVTRAAALPRAETVRLLPRLRRLDVQVPIVLVNAVGRGPCDRCATAAVLEEREIGALERAVSRVKAAPRVAVAATQLPPPRSPRSLHAWRREGWRYHQGA